MSNTLVVQRRGSDDAAECNYRKQKVLKVGFLQHKLNANVFFGNCLYVESIIAGKAPAVTPKKCPITNGVLSDTVVILGIKKSW